MSPVLRDHRFFSIPDLGSASKNLSIWTHKMVCTVSSQKYDLGCSSRIRILTFYHPDSRSRSQKGTGYRIRIRNTVCLTWNPTERTAEARKAAISLASSAGEEPPPPCSALMVKSTGPSGLPPPPSSCPSPPSSSASSSSWSGSWAEVCSHFSTCRSCGSCSWWSSPSWAWSQQWEYKQKD